MAYPGPVEQDLVRRQQTLDLRCVRCGYGVANRVQPPQRCPMCGATAWQAFRQGRAWPEL